MTVIMHEYTLKNLVWIKEWSLSFHVKEEELPVYLIDLILSLLLSAVDAEFELFKFADLPYIIEVF
jgi:hypothetical protein